MTDRGRRWRPRLAAAAALALLLPLSHPAAAHARALSAAGDRPLVDAAVLPDPPMRRAFGPEPRAAGDGPLHSLLRRQLFQQESLFSNASLRPWTDADFAPGDDPDAQSIVGAERAPVTMQAPPRPTRAPSRSWRIALGPFRIVPNNVDRQYSNFYHVTPDCFAPVLPRVAGGWMQFWSESSNYRTVATKSPFFEDAALLQPTKMVFGGAYNRPGYDNGGKWLMSVFRHPTKGGTNLIGFYHAQDNYGDPLNGGAAAWKTIGVAYSANDGVSWTNGGLIITSAEPRPPNSAPKFGGNGDHGAVWDYDNRRWVLFYGGENWLSMAISSDPDGRRGTWYKYAGPQRGFSSPGIRGRGFPVGGSQLPDGSFDWNGMRGLSLRAGSNPGIHYNVHLAKWIMLYNGWDNAIWVSANVNISDPDGWETPRLVVRSRDGTRAWHPTVVCRLGGSAWCPSNAGRLYYADQWRAPDRRSFVSRTITFIRND
ncbi:hypothetical protein DFJ74DRAFT_687337 [Hyaloraphidium curvatum]|nr:hypothetical protein DFJ74DRAFT_687337 [Hyaloraphidium curvatum]